MKKLKLKKGIAAMVVALAVAVFTFSPNLFANQNVVGETSPGLEDEGKITLSNQSGSIVCCCVGNGRCAAADCSTINVTCP